MDRRQASGVQGLLRRVRWGNVGTLAALLAVAVLLATGGRGSRPEQLPDAGPTERAVTRPGGVSAYPPEMAQKVDKRLAKRGAPKEAAREARRAAPEQVVQAAPQNPGPVAPQIATPQPVQPSPPPSPRSGEFTPDPAP